MDLGLVAKLIFYILILLFSLTVHEFAHGWVAVQLGDDTPHLLGRLSFNPWRHIDPIFTLVIPALLFWWTSGIKILAIAKPIPVNTNNLREPVKDLALIAIAGPMANFILAIACAVLGRVSILWWPDNWALAYLVNVGMDINLILGFLNLLPLPMLDGGHVIACLMPQSWVKYYDRWASSTYGLTFTMFFLLSGVAGFVIRPLADSLYFLLLKYIML